MAIKVPIVTEFNKSGLSDADRALRSFGVQSTKELKKAAAGFGLLAVAGAKAFSEIDKGYDAIVANTGATGDALKGLKADADAVARTVPNSFEQVGVAVAEVNTRLGLTGPAAQVMAKKFLDLARVAKVDVKDAVALTTRTFKDWGIAAEDQSAMMDQLFAATQQTGIGIERLNTLVVQFGAPMRQLGFSFEEAAALLSSFESEGVNTEAVMSGMKIGLGKLAAAGEDPAEAFGRIVEEIKNFESAGEAGQLAAEVFGTRAGPDMAAAIREGRFEIDDMVAALGDVDGALSTAAEETLSANDRFAMLKNQLLTASVPAIMLFAEVTERGVAALALFPEPVQAVAVGLAVLAVASKSAGSAIAAFGKKAKAATVASGAMSAAMVVAGAALVGYAAYSYAAQKANEQLVESIEAIARASDEQATDAFVASLIAGTFAGKDMAETLAQLAETSPGTIARIIELEESSGALTATFLAAGSTTEYAAETLDALGVALKDEKVALENAAATQERSNKITDDATGASEDLTDATKVLIVAERDLDNGVKEATAQIERSIEVTRAAREERRRLADGTYDALDAEDAFHDSVDRMIETQQSADATEREKAAAVRDSVKATEEMIAKQLEEQGVVLDSERGQREWSAAMADSAAFMGGELGGEILAHIGRVNGIPEEKITEAQALLDQGSVDEARRIIDTELDKAVANPEVVPVGLDAARARIESILGRRVNLSVSTYVPGGTGDNRSHVGSRFAAGQTKQVVPGQVWTPDVPGRLSSVEESQRMTSSASSGRVPLVIQLMDGAMVRREIHAEADARDAAAVAEFTGGVR